MRAGELLKLQTISQTSFSQQYAYPPGLTLYRILYTSKDFRNMTVPASGYILLPFHLEYRRTASTRTVIWTHGTSGSSRDCAPSADQGLFYNWHMPYALARDGYVVLAPDYAGLGADASFHYMSGLGHAEDVINMVRAVRDAMPFVNLTSWVVAGHSEGGMTSWATNELQSLRPDPGFLGSVALAPATNFVRTIARGLSTPSARSHFGNTFLGKRYSLFVFESVRRITEQLVATDHLTPRGVELLSLVTSRGCDATAPHILESFTLDDIYSDYTWANSAQSDLWTNLTMNRAVGALAKPLLIIQGDEDRRSRARHD